MGECQNLIDIGPDLRLCDHPCMLYGGGAVTAECDSCGYRVYDLEAENARLRKLVRQMYPRAKAFLQMGVQLGCSDTLSYDWQLQLRDLGIEVDE